MSCRKATHTALLKSIKLLYCFFSAPVCSRCLSGIFLEQHIIIFHIGESHIPRDAVYGFLTVSQECFAFLQAAGAMAGAGIAAFGPTAAMAVATTFGTASTGTAIATLSGAAATNAALAWLGGGALAVGGGGMAAGEAFLAMA